MRQTESGTTPLDLIGMGCELACSVFALCVCMCVCVSAWSVFGVLYCLCECIAGVHVCVAVC